MNNAHLKKIAKRFGTPLYVYDRSIIEKRCRELRRHFPGVFIHYAVKANSNPAILSIVRKEGLGIETVSRGEIRVGKSVGFLKKHISYTCSSQTVDDLRYAERNAGKVHIDSLVQLEMWGRLKLKREVSLRINEGVGTGHHRHVVTGGPDSKFGISEKDIAKARAIAKRFGLVVTGLEQHIGSNILNGDANVFLLSVRKLLKTARDFPSVTHLDFGGGFGIPYKPTDIPLNLALLGREFIKLIRAFEKERGRPMTFALEPGRFVVGEGGVLLATVVDLKSTSKHLFVGVNSGMNHLIRPAMYGSHHEITNVDRSTPLVRATVVGNVCESGDVFAWDRVIGKPKLGDVLAFRNAGAYGFTMASHYNLRSVPKEVLASSGKVRDISFAPSRYVQ